MEYISTIDTNIRKANEICDGKKVTAIGYNCILGEGFQIKCN